VGEVAGVGTSLAETTSDPIWAGCSGPHVESVEHTLGVLPPPQVAGATQGPQLSVPPQPSGGVPQVAPSAAQDVGTHGPIPHRFGIPPPPHVSDPVHAPQVSVPPQPSATVPHVAPTCGHEVGVQPHWFGTPPPPQEAGAVQTPHPASPIGLGPLSAATAS
jgi:hypothetical protein